MSIILKNKMIYRLWLYQNLPFGINDINNYFKKIILTQIKIIECPHIDVNTEKIFIYKGVKYTRNFFNWSADNSFIIQYDNNNYPNIIQYGFNDTLKSVRISDLTILKNGYEINGVLLCNMVLMIFC